MVRKWFTVAPGLFLTEPAGAPKAHFTCLQTAHVDRAILKQNTIWSIVKELCRIVYTCKYRFKHTSLISKIECYLDQRKISQLHQTLAIITKKIHLDNVNIELDNLIKYYNSAYGKCFTKSGKAMYTYTNFLALKHLHSKYNILFNYI